MRSQISSMSFIRVSCRAVMGRRRWETASVLMNLFFLAAQLTSVILVGSRVSSFLMMNRQKEQVGSSSSYGEEHLVILPTQKHTLYFYLIQMHFCFLCTHIGTAGSGSVFIGRKLGKFHKFLLFGVAKSKSCTRLLWLLKSVKARRMF